MSNPEQIPQKTEYFPKPLESLQELNGSYNLQADLLVILATTELDTKVDDYNTTLAVTAEGRGPNAALGHIIADAADQVLINFDAAKASVRELTAAAAGAAESLLPESDLRVLNDAKAVLDRKGPKAARLGQVLQRASGEDARATIRIALDASLVAALPRAKDLRATDELVELGSSEGLQRAIALARDAELFRGLRGVVRHVGLRPKDLVPIIKRASSDTSRQALRISLDGCVYDQLATISSAPTPDLVRQEAVLNFASDPNVWAVLAEHAATSARRQSANGRPTPGQGAEWRLRPIETGYQDALAPATAEGVYAARGLFWLLRRKVPPYRQE